MYLSLHCAGRAKPLALGPPAPRASSPYHAHRDATQGYGNMCPYRELLMKIKVKKPASRWFVASLKQLGCNSLEFFSKP